MSQHDRAARWVFWGCSVLLALGYGVIAGMFRLFPWSIFDSALRGAAQLADGADGTAAHWYYKQVKQPGPPPIQNPGGAQPGINLVTEIERDCLEVKVMDLAGECLHRWVIDWFELWPDASHVPERLQPRSQPGTHVDGAALLDDGELVFNFEHLGLVRLRKDGTVAWRLPYQTHHSVVRGDDGNLWVCGQKERLQALAGFPNLVPPFVEDTVLVVTTAGAIVREWSILELLRANGRDGLLYLNHTDNFSAAVSGDVTHLNHVEPFPAAMPAGFFAPGDVLVSLRNPNTVFVFDSRNDRIKFCCTGLFVRQHDPHFVDGSTISVLDNHSTFDTRGAAGGTTSAATSQQSRIVLVSAPTQAVSTYFSGTPATPFFTPILGRHQWLPNRHLLITDSCGGRAFELDHNRQVVWWYINYVEPGVVGAVEQVQRLPVAYAAHFR